VKATTKINGGNRLQADSPAKKKADHRLFLAALGGLSSRVAKQSAKTGRQK